MKTIMCGITGVATLVAIAAIVCEVFTVTDPYVVTPLTSSTAPAHARAGHNVGSGSRTLSIVSGRDVIVVADPGASFKHKVIWIVERPRKDGSHALREFTCNLPAHAAVDQIKPLGSSIPTKILETANGHRW